MLIHPHPSYILSKPIWWKVALPMVVGLELGGL